MLCLASKAFTVQESMSDCQSLHMDLTPPLDQRCITHKQKLWNCSEILPCCVPGTSVPAAQHSTECSGAKLSVQICDRAHHQEIDCRRGMAYNLPCRVRQIQKSLQTTQTLKKLAF